MGWQAKKPPTTTKSHKPIICLEIDLLGPGTETARIRTKPEVIKGGPSLETRISQPTKKARAGENNK